MHHQPVAKIFCKAAAPADTGSDPHCISSDMIEVSKIPTVTGLRYCTMIVERETRFAHIWLHATNLKNEIVQVFKRVLLMLTKKLLIIKSDCAPEYHMPELLLLFTEYGVKEAKWYGRKIYHTPELLSLFTEYGVKESDTAMSTVRHKIVSSKFLETGQGRACAGHYSRVDCPSQCGVQQRFQSLTSTIRAHTPASITTRHFFAARIACKTSRSSDILAVVW